MKNENLYTPDCIRTVSGIYVNVFDPKPEMFELSDIAWALSRMQRFTAHLSTSYTVLQHCRAVAESVTRPNKLAALLHNASEAYMHDLAGPIKHNVFDYKKVENCVSACIAKKFGFKYPLEQEVKVADIIALEWEWNHIMIECKDFEEDPALVRARWMREVLQCFFERGDFAEESREYNLDALNPHNV